VKNFNSYLKKELNPSQLQAVEHKKGGILVIAGAGSGKTRVITCRIANLIIKEKADPKSILALTFTNKAAKEMKERVSNFTGTDTAMPFVGTFHSYCLLLLRRNSRLLTQPQFAIIDEDDKKALLKQILKKNGLEKQIGVAALSSHISKTKNKVKDLEEEQLHLQQNIMKELYLTYESEKSRMHCLDFDDLLLNTLNLFKKNPEFKEQFQGKIKHILVDEYQDTNGVQHNLLKQMGLDKKNKLALDSICAVGDEDQSIYSWRGAVVKNISKFQKDFAPMQKIKIEQNYRSVDPILQAANSVIENNKIRNKKKLWSDRKAKNRILVLSCRSEYKESDAVASLINAITQKDSKTNIAILYRTHFQSRVIEEALLYQNIAYKIIGDIQFYQRKEIKDLLAYLRLIVNPYDKISFFRVINYPTRGLGTQFENQLLEEWEQNPLFDFSQLLKNILETTKLPPKKVVAIKDFLNIFEDLKKEHKASDLLDTILKKTQLISKLQTNSEPQESEMRVGNIKELIRAIDHFEKRKYKKPKGSSKKKIKNLVDFLEEIALIQDKQEMHTQDNPIQVQMMTLHAAKGLEFDTVIMAGLEEGVFPTTRSLNSYEAIEEERRLFYVGMTRAKNRLILTNAKNRNSYGELYIQTPSRFLGEVPRTLLQEFVITNERSYQLTSTFNRWLGIRKQTEDFMFFGAQIPKFAIENSKKEKLKKTKVPKIYKTPKAPQRKQNKAVKENKPSGAKKPGEILATESKWKKNQIVSHKTFGVGIVQKIEQLNSSKFSITVSFKNGTKKLLSRFLKRI